MRVFVEQTSGVMGYLGVNNHLTKYVLKHEREMIRKRGQRNEMDEEKISGILQELGTIVWVGNLVVDCHWLV